LIDTSYSFFSMTVRFPPHTGHTWACVLPLPPHFEQGCYICMTIMPMLTFCITTPEPLQTGHVFCYPSLAPEPRHALQYTFLLMLKFCSTPLYRSWRLTWMVTLFEGPFCRLSPSLSYRSTSSSPPAS
jgi:hypothetical protein